MHWVVLRGEQLRQAGYARQIEDTGRYVDQFQRTVALLDCGSLETDQRSEAGAVQKRQIAQVQHDAAADGNERLNQFFQLGTVSLTSLLDT
jgi:hypothetical protein